MLISNTFWRIPPPRSIGEILDLQLKGKHVLVTGSHRGTGNIIARTFIAEGASVFIHGFNQQDAEHAVEEAGSGIATWGDITADAGADEVLQQVLAVTEQVDVLVNNYGEAKRGKWQDTTAEDWIRLYEINTLSVVRMTQRCLPHMTRGGRIINLGTIGSTRPNIVMPHYYSAKGALATMTVSLAKETGPRGITANLVSPGLIRTPEVELNFLERAKSAGWGDTFEEAEARITQEFFPNPLGRIATREEVADVVLFLAGQQASFINGQNIRVDGGAVDIV